MNINILPFNSGMLDFKGRREDFDVKAAICNPGLETFGTNLRWMMT